MKKTNFANFVLAALTTAIFITLTTACSEAPTPKVEAPAPVVQGNTVRFTEKHPQLALIGTTAATPVKTLTIDLPAKLVWNEEQTQRIYASFAGRVTAIRTDIGQSVSVGQPLAILASPEFGAAQADAARAQADERLTQKNLARQKELFDAGITSRKDYDGALADSERALAESQRAVSRTKLYGGAASTGTSQGVNQQLSLNATVSGIVVERNLNPGQELRPDQSGVGIPPLFTISNPNSLWVQIDAKEGDLPALKKGSSFEIAVSSLGGQVFKGVIQATGDFIDPNTRTIKVRGLVMNPKRELKAEMLATARVTRDVSQEADAAVSVPASAALLVGAKHRVFIQSAVGTFEPREIEILFEGPKEVVIKSGIKAGDLVVSENALLLGRLWRMAQEKAKP